MQETTCRMISKLILESPRYLSLSSKAQALYPNLILHSDDEGIVESTKTLTLLKQSFPTLVELKEKGLIAFIDEKKEGQIVFIIDWNVHNRLRHPRQSVHSSLLEKYQKEQFDASK